MNCPTSTDRPSSENVTPEETARAVANGIAQLDLDRASAYAGLSSLRAGQDAAYAREEKLLARKYGDQHPRVLAIAQRRAVNQVLQRDLAIAHALAATPPPPVDPGTYAFHGHIRDCDLQPKPQLTVALYNARGDYLSSLGYGCSNEEGYFSLRGTPPENADGAETVATIRVYDLDQKLVCTECEPLHVAAGRSGYREIVICDTGTCRPPPDGPGEPPPSPLTVPDVIGDKEDAAKAELTRASFGVESSTRGTDDDHIGLVVEQKPGGGSKAAKGTVVAIVVGTPLPKITVPDLVERTLRDAQAILQNAGLTIGKIEPTGAPLTNPVVQQAPAAGAQVAPGSAVDLVVKAPVEKTTVPRVQKLPLGDAKKLIAQSGLTVGKIKPAGATDASIVADQLPAAGTEVDRGTAVDLGVAETPAKVVVPNVVTLKLSEAKQVLEKARLKIGILNPVDSGPTFIVAKQSLEADSEVAEGTGVNLDLRPAPTRSAAARKSAAPKTAAAKKKSRKARKTKRAD